MARHAEIAGGGFTGLVMGAALAQAGWTVRVHERTEEIRAFGAGIWIWDNGVRVLKAIGAADDALEGCTEAPTYISWDAKGRYIDEVPFAPISSTDRSRMFCITRQQLLSAILGAAERAGVEIVTGSTAAAARPEGVLITEDGREWPADLVIGADGINSKVRDSLGLLRSRKPHVDGAIRVLVPHEP
ncbi:MAG: NAD(P)/FAD-dependent oxidoreductase, partial [Rhodospirillales bacterium]|nr:NAD(P)/FAD-dependent oxidoreductase [Rhodospirillales bacterium]